MNTKESIVILPLWKNKDIQLEKELKAFTDTEFYNRELLGCTIFLYSKMFEDYFCNNILLKEIEHNDKRINYGSLAFENVSYVVNDEKALCLEIKEIITPSTNVNKIIGWNLINDVIPMLWFFFKKNRVNTSNTILFKDESGKWNNNANNHVDLISLYNQGGFCKQPDFYDMMSALGYGLKPKPTSVKTPSYPGYISDEVKLDEEIDALGKVAAGVFELAVFG